MDIHQLAKQIDAANPRGLADRHGQEIALEYLTARSVRILRHYATQRRITNLQTIVARATSDLQGNNPHGGGT
jgi:hypothetical protein